MPRGGGPAGQRGRAMAAQMGAARTEVPELSPLVRRWWELIRLASDGEETSLDELTSVVAGWDSEMVQQALRLVDLGMTGGQIRDAHARVLQSGLRMTQTAILSGATLAKVPDYIAVAYVQAEHILDPSWGSDDLNQRLTAPARVNEVQVERSDDSAPGASP